MFFFKFIVPIIVEKKIAYQEKKTFVPTRPVTFFLKMFTYNFIWKELILILDLNWTYWVRIIRYSFNTNTKQKFLTNWILHRPERDKGRFAFYLPSDSDPWPPDPPAPWPPPIVTLMGFQLQLSYNSVRLEETCCPKHLWSLILKVLLRTFLRVCTPQTFSRPIVYRELNFESVHLSVTLYRFLQSIDRQK